MLKEQCQLKDGLNSADLDALELLRGVANEEIRKEMPKIKRPKAAELVQIAREWIHGGQMDRKFHTALEIVEIVTIKV